MLKEYLLLHQYQQLLLQIQKTVNLTEGEQQYSLPVNELPAGMYILRMQGDKVQHTEKFIKQ